VGIQQLGIAADHGHYLRPFSNILLALAALREKQTEVACRQLRELVAEFPENPLFASELARLKAPPAVLPAGRLNLSRTEFALAIWHFCIDSEGLTELPNLKESQSRLRGNCLILHSEVPFRSHALVTDVTDEEGIKTSG
jgi:hypothetical protein